MRRAWVPSAAAARASTSTTPRHTFTVMSYNVLADTLRARHPFLYAHTHPSHLEWRRRFAAIVAEISAARPSAVCLQEVEPATHAMQFVPTLEAIGYRALPYAKRPGLDTPDGCSIFYRADTLVLMHAETVDFSRASGKNNVALLGVFAMAQPGPSTSTTQDRSARDAETAGEPESAVQPVFCLATTHLLFNTNRGLAKLAQLHTLVSRIQKVCMLNGGIDAVVCGDFNMTESGVLYHYMVAGETEPFLLSEIYLSGQNKLVDEREQQASKGKNNRNSWAKQWGASGGYQSKNRSTMQPFEILEGRRQLRAAAKANGGEGDAISATNLKLDPKSPNAHLHSLLGSPSGLLTHGFEFKDAILGNNHDGRPSPYFTTCHVSSQEMVDFMFYGRVKEKGESEFAGGMFAMEHLELPRKSANWNRRHCNIPSADVPSDHISLMVKFGVI
ncbi:Protein angel 1 [Entophlyctis luteolus]|nr:Protein angel 1 [Entophlyctis luteolus]